MIIKREGWSKRRNGCLEPNRVRQLEKKKAGGRRVKAKGPAALQTGGDGGYISNRYNTYKRKRKKKKKRMKKHRSLYSYSTWLARRTKRPIVADHQCSPATGRKNGAPNHEAEYLGVDGDWITRIDHVTHTYR